MLTVFLNIQPIKESFPLCLKDYKYLSTAHAKTFYIEDRNFVNTKTNGKANTASALGAVAPQNARLSGGRAGLQHPALSQ